MKQGTGASTAFELEATTVSQWCTLVEIEQYGGLDHSSQQQLRDINDQYSNNRNNEQFDPDTLMLWAQSRHILGRDSEFLNIINQVGELFVILSVISIVLSTFALWIIDCDRLYISILYLHTGHCHVPLVPARTSR